MQIDLAEFLRSVVLQTPMGWQNSGVKPPVGWKHQENGKKRMGFFSFVKSAGEILGIGGTTAPSAEMLMDNMADLGLKAEALDVSIEGDTVMVSGNANSQEEREKIVLALGNVAGVASVEETIEAAQPAPEATFYTVRSGDTLWKVASTYCGDGNKYQSIFEANRPMLSHPDKIYPGQVLRIPAL